MDKEKGKAGVANNTATQMSSSCDSFAGNGKIPGVSSVGNLQKIPRTRSDNFTQAPKRHSGNFDSFVNKPPVIKEAANPGGNKGELAPRRLSQLFLPLHVDELKEEVEKSGESSRLLSGADKREPKPVIIVTKSESQKPSSGGGSKTSGDNQSRTRKAVIYKNKSDEDELDQLSILDQIEDGKSEGDFSASSSSESEDETDEKDPSEPDPSWNDTICSNRSAYFKHYYQKNLSARPATNASSYTSLVSLIREKNETMDSKQSSEEAKRKLRRENIGLTVLVVFLFLVLVIGISLIYHFYNLHLLELSLFKKLKFQENSRQLHLYNLAGSLDIKARLGTNLGMYSKPEECTEYLHYIMNNLHHVEDERELDHYFNSTNIDYTLRAKRAVSEFQFDELTVCLDWANEARIQIHGTSNTEFDVNCYDVFWSTQHQGLPLQDCILLSSPESSVWWGLGDIAGGFYPLENVRDIPSTIFITAELDKHPWGRILRRSFISSQGALLTLPEHLPASVSITPEELCIAVSSSHQITATLPLMLNYTVCASPNISSTMKYLHHQWELENNVTEISKKQHHQYNMERMLERIENPIWIPFTNPEHAKLTQDGILEYVDQILANNESIWGHILLPLAWQRKAGELNFDLHRFPSPKNFTKALKRKGFNLALTISPLVSTDTRSFKNGTKEGLWVHQKDSTLPALIQFNTVVSGALIDFTNIRSAEWFITKLQNIKDTFGIDRFYLEPPDSRSIPMYHEFSHNTPNPDLALKYFINAVSKVSPPLSTEGALTPPPYPTFVTIGTEESGWKSLSSLIPRILTLTMLGYNLIDAGIIGGNPGRPGNIPDEELFIRWSQAAAFLPAYQMNTLPGVYEGETKSIVSNAFEIRRTVVMPRFKANMDETLRNNTPLIFPLALLYPDDSEATVICNEWIIGNDLLVAPVLEKDQVSRDIYIPDGLWESQLDGRLKRGPGWIYNYKVPLTDVAYFIRKFYSKLS